MRTCAVIPTYNNLATAKDIVLQTLEYLPVIVVADGPTDGTLESLETIQNDKLVIVSYAVNKGKGYALKQGFLKARELGYTHVLTIDSDGQHYPEDIPALLRMSAVRPEAIILGSRILSQKNMPLKNTFANRFSNFWYAFQTGISLSDTQTGFRVYPLQGLHGLHLMTHRYEAELMLLVFSAWANTPVIPVQVRVYYPPVEERVSYFRPVRDFTRISVLNTLLCILAIVYGWPRSYWRTVYYSFLFVLFAIWANIIRDFYHLFKPKDMSVLLRLRLLRGSRFFLSAFPNAPYKVCYARETSGIDVNKPCIYIANHTSLLDILAIISLHERMLIMAKGWILNNIFFGRVAKSMGVISIEEGWDNMAGTMQEYVNNGYSIAIFPEGTRSVTGELGRFHRGAFYLAEQMQLPICPILLDGFGQGLSKSPFHVGTPEELKVTILPLIQPDDASYGADYRERSRLIRKYYWQLIAHS